MDILKVIKERRSVRSYKDDPVPEALVAKLVEAGRWAPSGGNLQPWHFYIVEGKEKLHQLFGSVLSGPSWQLEAPLAIVITVRPEVSHQRYFDRGSQLYCLQDSGAAAQNILLTAHSLGLSGCWIGSFDEMACSQTLSLPKGDRPVAILAIGYPAGDNPSPTPRQSVAEVSSWIK